MRHDNRRKTLRLLNRNSGIVFAGTFGYGKVPNKIVETVGILACLS